MAYDSTQLHLITATGGHSGQTWRYRGTDAPSAVAVAGFISDGYDRGMKIGDIVEVEQYTTTAFTTFVAFAPYRVSAVVSGTGATLSGGAVTATAAAGAATANGLLTKITSESLTTAAAATYTLTLTNNQVAAGDIALVSVDALTTTGTPGYCTSTVTLGQVVVVVRNHHATVAFNGPIQINVQILKP